MGIDSDKPLRPDDVYLKAGDEYAVYNWYTGDLTRLQESNTLSAGYEGHCYAVVTPIVNGWIFLGEVDKYVPASSVRFSHVDAQEHLLTAMVHGVKGEKVRVCAARTETMAVRCSSVAFDEDTAVAVPFQVEQFAESIMV